MPSTQIGVCRNELGFNIETVTESADNCVCEVEVMCPAAQLCRASLMWSLCWSIACADFCVVLVLAPLLKHKPQLALLVLVLLSH
jgi:hypothetical protein